MGYINGVCYRCGQVGGTSQRAHVIGHLQFLIFHKVGAGEVELVEHLEIMHVSLLRDIPVEYFSLIGYSKCSRNTFLCNSCIF